MDDLTSTVKDEVSAAQPELGQQFTDLKADIQRLSGTVAELAMRLASTAGTQLSSLAGSVRDSVPQAGSFIDAGQEFAQSTYAQARDREAQLERTIRANPVTSLLVAAGVGLLLGMMSRSRD